MTPDDFPLLTLLDSPLLAQLAPELVPFRAELVGLSKRAGGSCSSCEQRKLLAAMTTLQIKIQDVIEKNPDLQAVLPQLRASMPGKG